MNPLAEIAASYQSAVKNFNTETDDALAAYEAGRMHGLIMSYATCAGLTFELARALIIEQVATNVT